MARAKLFQNLFSSLLKPNAISARKYAANTVRFRPDLIRITDVKVKPNLEYRLFDQRARQNQLNQLVVPKTSLASATVGDRLKQQTGNMSNSLQLMAKKASLPVNRVAPPYVQPPSYIPPPITARQRVAAGSSYIPPPPFRSKRPKLIHEQRPQKREPPNITGMDLKKLKSSLGNAYISSEIIESLGETAVGVAEAMKEEAPMVTNVGNPIINVEANPEVPFTYKRGYTSEEDDDEDGLLDGYE